MRINAASTLTPLDIVEAIELARHRLQDIWLMDDGVIVGKRGAMQFWCESHWGKYTVGRNDSYGHKAATWTAFGWVIAELFTRDPNARIGHYRSRDHFIRCIYQAQAHYIRRASWGFVRGNKGDYERGENCEFLSLFNNEEPCPDCDGSGIRSGIGEGYCDTCEATGTVNIRDRVYSKWQAQGGQY